MPTYYFDPTAAGSSGAGTFANPYTNQAQLAGMPAGASTTLLFKRGTRWRPGLVGTGGNFANLLIPGWFFTYNNNSIDAYGEGAKPIIDGSIDLTGWSLVGGYSDVYSKAMSYEGGSFYIGPGNLRVGGTIPKHMRWRGSLAATLAAAGSSALVQTYDFNAQVWYLRSPSAPSGVTASYWRVIHSNSGSISTKVTGCSLKNLRAEQFSAYCWTLAGMEDGLVDGLEGACIGGYYRSAFAFWEGNFFDIRAGNDGITVQNCTIDDCFDSGLSPQFGNGWDVWNSLSNVTLKNNTIRRCGLCAFEVVSQSETGCSIDGVYIDDNVVEDMGRGPFADTESGTASVVGLGQAGGSLVTSLTTNVYARRNRIRNSQMLAGDMKGPQQIFLLGNIATMDPASKRSGDTFAQAIWTVANSNSGTLRVTAYGNVIVGYDHAFAVSSWGGNNFALEMRLRRNTIIGCANVYQGHSKSNATFRAQNTLLQGNTTIVAGFGSSTFVTEGGLYCASGQTLGFTPDGADATSQAAITVDADYMPVSGAAVYSGGVNANSEHFDYRNVAFSGYPTSRNAYATFASAYTWDGKKMSDALLAACMAAANGAAPGAKEAAYLTAAQSGIGSGYRYRLLRDGVSVWSATKTGNVPIAGAYLSLPVDWTQEAISAADIDTGFWLFRLEKLSDSEVFAASPITKGSGTPNTLADDLAAAGVVTGGTMRLRAPVLDA